ncbi:T5orf172 domain-containing protein [Microdochium trichocladiopsis]|uniref:T5orf172 domain-containing protein n=1 Tax=Microdochium trichocladiopsis TaxID=1682393 RepID=A0A9P8XWS1_9PEZI|nr:T5orf172 domain-containing protein [Microdochium trichocladiopsis]KAH7021618.1 T5orf172 domain-containing protein [Microdochium trichocladiopsis]
MCNCCGPKPGGARHRNRIEDVGVRNLLLPLARRWKEEIRKYDAATIASLRVRTASAARPPLSRFRPHIEEPGQDVASKLRLSLSKDKGLRDFSSGHIYIYSRDEDPGFVKIGWTSFSVRSRLEEWASCGYTPRLIYSSREIPFAQRAETLVHYELSPEWRAERVCQGCRRSHREWFEVDQARAIRVVKDWEDFMTLEKVYDDSGRLVDSWVRVTRSLVNVGMEITARRLLEHRRSLLSKVASPRAKTPKPVGKAFSFTNNSLGILADISTSIPPFPQRYTFLPAAMASDEKSPSSPMINKESPSETPSASSAPAITSPLPAAPLSEQGETPARDATPALASASTTQVTDRQNPPTFTFKPVAPGAILPTVTPVQGPFGTKASAFDPQAFSNLFNALGKIQEQQSPKALTPVSNKQNGGSNELGPSAEPAPSKSPSRPSSRTMQGSLGVNAPEMFEFLPRTTNEQVSAPEALEPDLTSDLNALKLTDEETESRRRVLSFLANSPRRL